MFLQLHSWAVFCRSANRGSAARHVCRNLVARRRYVKEGIGHLHGRHVWNLHLCGRS